MIDEMYCDHAPKTPDVEPTLPGTAKRQFAKGVSLWLNCMYCNCGSIEDWEEQRRPGKCAHVAVDVKLAAMYAAMIRSKEVASRTLGRSLCNPRRSSSSHLFPTCLSRLRQPDAGGERSRFDSQIRDRAVGRRQYVWVQCTDPSLFSCASAWDKAEAKIDLHEEKCP